MIPKLSDRKQTRLPGSRGLGRVLTAKDSRELFRVMKLFYIFFVVMVIGLYTINKIYQPVYFV